MKYYKIQNRSQKNLILVYLEGPLPNLGSLTVICKPMYIVHILTTSFSVPFVSYTLCIVLLRLESTKEYTS